ncbi:MAG TPA: endonuclease III [Candidatus Diapherotrites archaeon]|uniref:Endonuclease III n=1 Tax=Candidatus Iainarchaeum sp. TaxID=3101447 RepID=A0A7J4KY32_9ARCH|nr:endonuclease III [Candidatus Diapherotrites archaeon]
MRLLRKEIGITKPAVLHPTPFKTLISTVLSARTKDSTTFPASVRLFKKFPNAKKLSKASVREVQKLIFPVGFYKTKAKRIIRISKILLQKFHGKVPKTLPELISLPGVGRKTANIVLAFSFRIPAIAVDTHVHRISNRLGIVEEKTPEKTEQALMKVLPKKYWLEINELMVKFGQRKCFPRSPNCFACSLQKHCGYYKNVFLKHSLRP